MKRLRRSLEAVVFDLDGLAVDSEPVHLEAWRRAMEEFGAELDPSSIRPYFGRPVASTAAGLAGEFHLDQERVLDARNRAFDELARRGLPPRPGLVEAVRTLRRSGLRCGLVTSGTREYARAVLDTLQRDFGAHHIHRIANHGLNPPRTAPGSPAELLDLDPSSCAVLEDAPAGVASAKAAGMAVVAVPNESTSGLDFSSADAEQSDVLNGVRWLLATSDRSDN